MITTRVRVAAWILAFSLTGILVGCGEPELVSETELPAEPTANAQGPGTPIPADAVATDTPPGDASPGEPATQPSPAPPAPPTAPTAPPLKKVLDVKWQGQETYYWCGPGSTRLALSTRLATPPSQTALANEMGTTVNGTDHIGLAASALNKHFGVTTYRSRVMNDPPTPAQRTLLASDLRARINAGFPIVANVVSGWRPAGYPGGTIYHYVAVVGFDEGGNKVLIADPAAEGKGGSASWNNVRRTYWISLTDLGTWIGGKGYTG